MHDGHRDRMRERFVATGADGFSEHELLEMLLYYSIPRRNTNDIAHTLINTFGSLDGVMSASVNDLMQVDGIGKTSALLISITNELMRKCNASDSSNKRIITINDAVNYFSKVMRGLVGETVYLMCLDIRYKIISCTKVADGSFDAVPIDVRKIVKLALAANSPHVILAHNHPAGNPRPSVEDVKATQRVMSALSPLSINMIDHVIISPNGFYSFSAQSLIQNDFSDEREVYAAQYADWSK